MQMEKKSLVTCFSMKMMNFKTQQLPNQVKTKMQSKVSAGLKLMRMSWLRSVIWETVVGPIIILHLKSRPANTVLRKLLLELIMIHLLISGV